MVEARRIVDAGNDRGLGYLENSSVATATLSSQRQYFTSAPAASSPTPTCTRGRTSPRRSRPPPLDHVDVFLDWMKMDHEIDFRDRLDINTYAIDPADLFLSKLQIQKLNEKDAHDVITLCKDVYVGFEPHPGVLDLEHVADTCARDWGCTSTSWRTSTRCWSTPRACAGACGRASASRCDGTTRSVPISAIFMATHHPVLRRVRASAAACRPWRASARRVSSTPPR
jgi:hypothetical protein